MAKKSKIWIDGNRRDPKVQNKNTRVRKDCGCWVKWCVVVLVVVWCVVVLVVVVTWWVVC